MASAHPQRRSALDWCSVVHRRHHQHLFAWRKLTPSFRPTSDDCKQIPPQAAPKGCRKHVVSILVNSDVRRTFSAAQEPVALTSDPLGAPIDACDRLGLYKLFWCIGHRPTWLLT